MNAKVTSMKPYVSFFQSVITVGILNCTKTKADASKQAKEQLRNSTDLNYCVFEQTPFAYSMTEAWDKEPCTLDRDGTVILKFKPSQEMKNVIGARLHKTSKDLTHDDVVEFIKESLKLTM